MLATMLHRNNIVWCPALLAVHKHMQKTYVNGTTDHDYCSSSSSYLRVSIESALRAVKQVQVVV
jgi:hypothetical protein